MFTLENLTSIINNRPNELLFILNSLIRTYNSLDNLKKEDFYNDILESYNKNTENNTLGLYTSAYYMFLHSEEFSFRNKETFLELNIPKLEEIKEILKESN